MYTVESCSAIKSNKLFICTVACLNYSPRQSRYLREIACYVSNWWNELTWCRNICKTFFKVKIEMCKTDWIVTSIWMMIKKIHNYIIVYGYCVCSCRPHFKAWVDDSPKLSLQNKLDRASASKKLWYYFHLHSLWKFLNNVNILPILK